MDWAVGPVAVSGKSMQTRVEESQPAAEGARQEMRSRDEPSLFVGEADFNDIGTQPIRVLFRDKRIRIR